MPIHINGTLYNALTYKHRGAAIKYTKGYFNGQRVLGGTPHNPPEPPPVPENHTKVLWHFDDVGMHPVDEVSGFIMADTSAVAPDAGSGVPPTAKFGAGFVHNMPATRVNPLVLPVGSDNHESQNWTVEAWVYYMARYYACGFMGLGEYNFNSGAFSHGYYLGWATPYTSWGAENQQAYFLAGANDDSAGIGSAHVRNNGVVKNFAQETWHHLALVKSGKILRGFLNGALVSEAENVPYVSSNNAYQSGSDYTGPQFLIVPEGEVFGCGVDEVRISDIARYTTDFTPPTQPFAVNDEVS